MPDIIRTIEEFHDAPAEFQQAVRKLVRSHAINELVGAQIYDEPAIALAPDPRAKWLTCRVAMEEYGHHLRFFELGRALGIADADMLPDQGKPALSIFAAPLAGWAHFCVIKLLADLAEIVQVEDLAHCAFHPLRDLARMTMPEERFHAEFGRESCALLCRGEDGRRAVQMAIDATFPDMPGFFGAAGSHNNEIYRKWGLKLRTNEQMRQDYLDRARALVEDQLRLRLPGREEAA